MFHKGGYFIHFTNIHIEIKRIALNLVFAALHTNSFVYSKAVTELFTKVVNQNTVRKVKPDFRFFLLNMDKTELDELEDK